MEAKVIYFIFSLIAIAGWESVDFLHRQENQK